MATQDAAKESTSGSASTPQFVSFDNTSELLVHLSKRVIEIINARDYSNPFLDCLSPELVGTNGATTSFGKVRVLADFQGMIQRYPNYRADVQNVTCSVDDDAGRAAVVMTTRISGYAYDTVCQAATLFNWTRHKDRWTCASWQLVRRIEEFD